MKSDGEIIINLQYNLVDIFSPLDEAISAACHPSFDNQQNKTMKFTVANETIASVANVAST